MPPSVADTPESAKLLQDFAHEHARTVGLPEDYVDAVFAGENGWKANPVSDAGAIGPAQLMPATARRLGVKNIHDPVENLRAGIDLLKSLSDRFHGDLVKAYAGYNSKPDLVEKRMAEGKLRPETQKALSRIFKKVPQYIGVPWQPPSVGQTQAPALGPSEAAASEDGLVHTATSEDISATPEEPPATVMSSVKQAGSSIAETATGLFDLPQTAVNAAARAAGLPEGGIKGGVSGLVEPHLAGPPQNETERNLRTGTGQAALGYIIGRVIPGGTRLKAAAEAVIQGGSAILGRYGGDISQDLGYGRLPGEVIGMTALPGVTALARGGATFVRGTVAARNLVTETAATEAKSAEHLAAVTADTEAKVGQVEAAAAKESEARASAVGQAQATAAARHATAKAIVEDELMQMTPDERADRLRGAVMGEEEAWVQKRTQLYEGFLGKEFEDSRGPAHFGAYGDLNVPMRGFQVPARDIEDQYIKLGLPADAASREAARLVKLAEQPDLTLQQAHAIKSEIGRIFAKATGPTKYRAGHLLAEIDKSMQAALPKEVYATYKDLATVYKHELNLYRHTIGDRILTDTEQGRDAALRYTAKLITGQKWSPAKVMEVRKTLEMVGTNTVGHQVLKDATFRQALERATTVTAEGIERTDWAGVLRHLENPEGLNPLFLSIMPNAGERARLLQSVREAAEGQRMVSAAAARAKAPLPWVTEARAAQKTVIGAAKEEAARASAAASAAKANAPPSFTVFDAVLGEGGRRILGAKGMFGLPIARYLFRWMRTGTNRALLRQSMRTAADSTAGRQLLQSISVAASHLRPAEAAANQDQVQSTP